MEMIPLGGGWMCNLKWGEEYRTVQVCVDDYEAGVFNGRFYHPMRPEGETFRSLSQYLLKTGILFEEMAWPPADTKLRTFADCPAPPREVSGQSKKVPGLLATFRVRVLFRQHASWQGEVIWTEQGQVQSFRSVLELILLLDSALQNRKRRVCSPEGRRL